MREPDNDSDAPGSDHHRDIHASCGLPRRRGDLFSQLFVGPSRIGDVRCARSRDASRRLRHPRLDYSGHGESGDEIITFDPLIEDFRSASGWLADQGFTRQVCVGHEFGATVALRAHSPAVQTYVLVSPVLGPLSYDWDMVFSDVQLSDLERHGTTTVPDDSESVRRHFTINKGTLADMSMVSSEKVLRGVSVPVLITHDASTRKPGCSTAPATPSTSCPTGPSST